MNRVINDIPEETEIETYHSGDDDICPMYLVAGKHRNVAVTVGIFPQDYNSKLPEGYDFEPIEEDLDESDLEDKIGEDEFLFDEGDENFVYDEDFDISSRECRPQDYVWVTALHTGKNGTETNYFYFGKIDSHMVDNLVLCLIYDQPNALVPLSTEERMLKFPYDVNPVEMISIICKHIRQVRKRINRKVI